MLDVKCATFLIRGGVSEEDEKVISELNEILHKMGRSGIEIHSHERMGERYNCLTISCDTDGVHEFMRRGAGRKQKQQITYTISEVREMMQVETAEKVAQKLEMSRATLFRRLKQYDEDYKDYRELEEEMTF